MIVEPGSKWRTHEDIVKFADEEVACNLGLVILDANSTARVFLKDVVAYLVLFCEVWPDETMLNARI